MATIGCKFVIISIRGYELCQYKKLSFISISLYTNCFEYKKIYENYFANHNDFTKINLSGGQLKNIVYVQDYFKKNISSNLNLIDANIDSTLLGLAYYKNKFE